MLRRDLFRTSLALGAGAALPPLAAPGLGIAQEARSRALRFVPQADAAILDPVITTGLVNRNHGFLVFDTLYGVDEAGRIQPQMVEGHSVEDDGRLVTMRLREGLRFHDGEPVRGRDVVASLRRWAARDAFGTSLMAAVDELTAPDDRTLRWRLKRPFPLLPQALGKVGAIVAFIMPERLAAGTDPAVPVKELVGSGPFRFRADQHVPGSMLVYERFAGYVPRPGEAPSLLAGGKVAHFDRVEWRVIPDAATVAGALRQGEVDWWDQPIFDLLPALRQDRNLVVENLDPYGNIGVLRFNHTLPPFNNPAIRRAILGAVRQSDVMLAVAGEDRSMWRDRIGFFAPGGAMANDEGIAALDGSRSIEASQKALKDAGYKGETVLLMAPSDFPVINAMSEVIADLFRRLGIKVDYQVMDWGSMLRRMANRETPEKGGYNAFCTYSAGVTQLNPSAHNFLRGSGEKATFGWSTSPELEALRDEWFAAPDAAAQKAIGVRAQRQAFIDVPYVPLGLFYQPTAYRKELAGVLKGLPLFWNVRRG
ncbi:ABC transporter substrate-binding protein [Teichococcus oryzae]|uniref:ABC transporter substrate-binding protein n=1 Tax=Teichococcus oryzae TaxID=1608942 RepID=A0A5B2THP4_9PROT|nr:ABC transporter substrate-binding protein [Pseudoroseomonas oryzae]KAA2214006.1 ABC transporter substrate-binding protein [Pseudoroseomonas oryzae]